MYLSFTRKLFCSRNKLACAKTKDNSAKTKNLILSCSYITQIYAQAKIAYYSVRKDLGEFYLCNKYQSPWYMREDWARANGYCMSCVGLTPQTPIYASDWGSHGSAKPKTCPNENRRYDEKAYTNWFYLRYPKFVISINN